MEGTIDGYSQMRIYVTEKDTRTLEEEGQVIGEVWRTTDDTLPLRIYLKDVVRAESIPTDKSWEEKEAYEIDITREFLHKIRGREVIGFGYPSIKLRTVIISLEDVF